MSGTCDTPWGNEKNRSLVEKLQRKRRYGEPEIRRYDDPDWIKVARNAVQWRNSVMNVRVPYREFLKQLNNYKLFKEECKLESQLVGSLQIKYSESISRRPQTVDVRKSFVKVVHLLQKLRARTRGAAAFLRKHKSGQRTPVLSSCSFIVNRLQLYQPCLTKN